MIDSTYSLHIMEKIPLTILSEISLYLSLKDLFLSFALTNKKCLQVLEDERFLRLIFLNTFNASEDMQIDRSSILNVFRNMKNRVYLDFIGFGTTGGCQNDDYDYWVGNLYDKSDRIRGYPSARNVLNINTAGVLAQTQSNFRIKRKKDLEKLYEEIYNEQYPEGRLDAHSMVSNLPPGKEKSLHKFWEMYNELDFFPRNMKNYRRRPENNNVLVFPMDFEFADSMKVFFVIKDLFFSRSLNYTCPVETFMVFISDTLVDIESVEFDRFNDLLTPESLDLLGDEFDISELKEQTGVIYRTFLSDSKRYHNLKPLLWGKFSKTAEKIDVELDDWCSGVYLYTKLIDPYNQNLKFGHHHGEFNIDAHRVRAKGLEVIANTK